MMKDENGNTLIGYLDVGGLLLPRAQLAETLPDMRRFERCLTDAQMVSAHMTEHGEPPDAFFGWSEAHMTDVSDTMREVGALLEQAVRRLHEMAARA
jgi:hypothetical protein